MRSVTTAAFVTTLTLIAGPAAAQFEIDSFFTGADAPRIDGNLEEWATAEGEELIPFTPLDDGDRMGGDGAWEGEDDISLEFAVANNAKNLFLAFKIREDGLRSIQAPTSFKNGPLTTSPANFMMLSDIFRTSCP